MNFFQYMFGALRDCSFQLKLARHNAEPAMMIDTFQKEVMQEFREVKKNYFPSILCKLSISIIYFLY